jgi:hypothetical protein
MALLLLGHLADRGISRAQHGELALVDPLRAADHPLAERRGVGIARQIAAPRLARSLDRLVAHRPSLARTRAAAQKAKAARPAA